MEYLKRKKKVMVQARVFSDLNNMNMFLEHNTLDILLIEESLYPLQERDYSNIRIIVLAENKDRKMGILSIFKYQSGESIIAELINICPELRDGEVNQNIQAMKLFSIYSLGSGGVGEIFSYFLAREYGNQGKVLFINLEPFTGLKQTKVSDAYKGMSDVIYYVNEKVDNLKEKLELIIKSTDNIDLILEVIFSTDLYDLNLEGIKILLTTIRDYQKYKYCIINTGYISSAVIELFKQSSKIYIITDKEDVTHRRKDNLVRQLAWAGFDEILKNLHQICLNKEDKDVILRTYEEGEENESIMEYIKRFI